MPLNTINHEKNIVTLYAAQKPLADFRGVLILVLTTSNSPVGFSIKIEEPLEGAPSQNIDRRHLLTVGHGSQGQMSKLGCKMVNFTVNSRLVNGYSRMFSIFFIDTESMIAIL